MADILPLISRALSWISPEFLTIYAIILFFEYFFPAVKNQKPINASVINDLIWSIQTEIFFLIYTSAMVVSFMEFYNLTFPFLSFESLTALPYWLRFILVAIIGEFLDWCGHVLLHKVPWLWYFHSIHHAQTRLSMLTAERIHIVDTFVLLITRVSVMYVFSIEEPQVIYYIFLLNFFCKMQHANVKTNYGWLRYILISPQSHRIHHSIEPKHYNKNFGSIFTIWDYIFNTQYRGYEEYPSTGIRDSNFPQEKDGAVLGLIKTHFLQQLYPFQRIGADIKRMLSSSKSFNINK